MNDFSIACLHEYDENKLRNIIMYLDEQYHTNGKSIISDHDYDYIKEYMKSSFPNNTVLSTIGSCPKVFVTLPVHMGSMDKIKNNQNELHKWCAKNTSGNCVQITDKLDGVSALLIRNNDGIKLYSRGDGTKGQDISNLFPHLQNTKHISKSSYFMIRGELIIAKNTFKNMIKKQIVKVTSNPRNTVAGIVNAKNPNINIVNHIRFVGYEVYSTSSLNECPSHQINVMNKLNIEYVNNKSFIKKELSINSLKNILHERKTNGMYEIDGLVVSNDIDYTPTTYGNPKYAFAFKMDTEEQQVTVTDVEWNLSKDAYLIPTIRFEPVKLQGVEICKATGFNAKFIFDNNINVGSVITITRSGDVVPHVTSVVSMSTCPKMPSLSYTWNDSKVHVIGSNDDDLNLKLFQNMVVSLKVKGVSNKFAKRLFDNNVNTLGELFNVDKQTLLKIEGVKDKMAENILKSIVNVKQNLTCEDLMIASNIFGRGIGKEIIQKVTYKFPHILESPPSIENLIKIDGIEQTTAQKIIQNVPKFVSFLNNNKLKHVKPKSSNDEFLSNKFEGCYFVFTGVKDKRLLDMIPKHMGVIEKNITKKTTHLVTDDLNGTSSKLVKARKEGVEIINYMFF